MKNISIFKKIKLFYQYLKLIKSIELEKSFGARVDNAGRIYTVLNIPSALIEEPYNLKSSDIDALSESYIRDYSQKLAKYLDSNGLLEMYSFYEMKKVAKYSYLLVYGFSMFNSSIYYRYVYITLSLLILLIIFSLFVINF